MSIDVDPAGPALLIGAIAEDWTGEARFHEYTRAANPVGRTTPLVPVERFGAALHASGPTRVIPLDQSAALATPVAGTATTPALAASFVRILPGEHVRTEPVATSELYFVLRGTGVSVVDGSAVEWSTGDFLVLPGGCRSTHHATGEAVLYWVTDEPLLRYLGAAPVTKRFRPTRFTAERCSAELAKVAADPRATQRSRISVLLANSAMTQTLTASHVLWAMYGLLPAGQVQRPHRHQSVAVDLIVDCAPGCYTLVGRRLDGGGEIVDPVRVDWEAGGAFVTPPGLWHAHHNDSDADAYLVPVQDAGLHTYLRTLDIRFS
ncbi:MAG: cupin domain-containing protein [Actinobacteria bacterium]|nr:cupin domain-containing protein [Actinomycetota bacterium]